ncbi:MAG TPA: chemotaxis protein CheW [Syntrophales bacterium]|nr:chemotaxis protein CheW [Syntrophales bacterium]HRT27693.1 chemotaxis protein CheW [Syntrophales bacterium]HRT70993.1 chemotaxis protein CheW [Syntrophales bacterium]
MMQAVEAGTEMAVMPQEKSREGKYLTFVLGGEEYGLEILKVKEIIGVMNITAVPQMPRYVKGVINLRGKVIPVVDLRLKFGMESLDYNERTCIIVVDIASGGSKVIMGIVVDCVSEVLNIKAEEIEDAPAFGVRLNTDYILGMAKVKGNVKILLDIDKVLTADVVAAEKVAH